jgi:xanthine dehydrogenase small subunit
MTAAPHVILNGAHVALAGTDPAQSLLRWLKHQHLTGTKEGCADGDCGACTVALVEPDGNGGSRYLAVNSCLLPMGFLAGREVLTVEALAQGDALHPVQQALVECAGSQCGYCTPGFVMSLFCGYYARTLSDATIEGNLCRCTGYQPIRAAAARLGAPKPSADSFMAALRAKREPLARAALARFFSPTRVDEALTLKAEHPEAAWIAGATDLGVELSHHRAPAPAFIALDRIDELKGLSVGNSTVRIGAGTPLSTVQAELEGLFPALDQMLRRFAGTQIRNRATFGGNLGTASPIGDLLPLLLALEGEIHCRGARGDLHFAAEEFFLGYRKTARALGELIVAVKLPRRANQISASYKVAKRPTDDISIVAATFALEFDAMRRVGRARLAFGGVAPMPVRAKRTEALLLGRSLDRDTMAQAQALLQAEFDPISDHRASSDYRRALCGNLFAQFVAEQVA